MNSSEQKQLQKSLQKMLILDETLEVADIFSHIAAIYELLKSIRFYTQRDKHKLLIIKQHIDEIRRLARKSQESKENTEV